jgi:calcium-dependent protein kinase
VSFEGSQWTFVRREVKELIVQMLNKDPTKRPTADEVMNHPWIKMGVAKKIKENPIAANSLKHLNVFKTRRKLEQATRAYIANQMITSEEIEEIRRAFISFDENGDGKLSRDELIRGYKENKMNLPDDIDEVLDNCDADRNGFIEYNEFLTSAMNWQKAMSKERLRLAFKDFDKDQSGKISLIELRQALGGAEASDEDVWISMIEEADKDGDGEIDLEEFTDYMMNRSQPMEASSRV